MQRGLTGILIPQTVGGETWKAFVPHPLPPAPPIEWSSPELQTAFQRASVAVGKLDSVTDFLPDPALFLYSYVRKEALLSSQIEGTQSTLDELLKFESADLPGAPTNDVLEVSNYVAAMEHGLARLREGFPLSLRLLREIHGKLLEKGRGAQKQPGEFRTSQNWIGGSRPGTAAFVPAPPDHLLETLGALEKFLHDESTPTLIKAALAHVQFETIHPFLDGNGRVGRLLITLLLCHNRMLSQPLLYLSLHLKQNRADYYALLQRVRLEGVWEEWILFFLRGIAETAEQAAATVKRVVALFAADARRIEDQGRAAATMLRVHRILQKRLSTSAKHAAAELDLSFPAVNGALEKLVELGVARELTGTARNRVFAYDAYLRILGEGTEPL
jgi:Fic family protein